MELLSPAGNLETAIAAFDGGADAVYCGLGRFNARERAENFTPDSLGKLLEFSRNNGKKVYLTLNTLVWESELGMLFEQLLILDKIRPDALIVQDPGVIEIVRKYFPSLPLHGSTQMGIHNSAGVKLAEKLGLKRVILERQLTLDELKKIAANSSLELEVFLHGSLCCSLSGRCLLSHWLYGESGNRGKCKQPCRRAFNSDKASEMRILSPADLAGAALLGELRKLGIASLKIEGRLRTPDYIWKTARAYRILLDNPDDPAAHHEAETILKSVPGRKKSSGFYFKHEWKNLISPAESGSFGECCAAVDKVIRSGMLVTVRTSLHLGDRLRVMPSNGGEGFSFSLSSMENRKREKIIRARAGETVFITGNFQAAAGHEIRRIGENGFDFSRRAATLPEYKRKISLNLDCSANMWHAEIPGIRAKWHVATSFSPAEKQPFSPAKAGEVFSEALPGGFCIGHINVNINGKFFVPAGILKNLRRQCWDFFAPHLQQHDFFPEHADKMEAFYAETHPDMPEIQPMPLPEKNFYIAPFIAETDLHIWQEKIRQAYSENIRDFTVTHWHGFALLTNLPDIRIHVEYPFHISNSFAVKFAVKNGATSATITPECPDDDATMLIQKSPIILQKNTTSPPLLVSRLPLKTGVWHNAQNRKFQIKIQDGMAELHAHDPFEVTG